MSFNRTLWQLTGRQIGHEARSLMNAGQAGSTYWAPVINLAREPRWGRNIEGQCVPPAGPFLQVAAGGQHCVGLRENGTVVCWGRNDQGQTDAPDGNFTQVNAFGLHSLAIRGPEFGACCTGNQLQCVITTEEKCDPVLGVTWLGAGSTCMPDSCSTPCQSDATGDGIIDYNDLISLLSNWGPCTG